MKFPQNCLIVIADGTQAKCYRNGASDGSLDLSLKDTLTPQSLDNDGPAGKRPKEESQDETDEATFAKQLAETLNSWALINSFSALVLAADPQTLGQIRPSLHNEVQKRIVLEHAKTLTTATQEHIERSLNSAD